MHYHLANTKERFVQTTTLSLQVVTERDVAEARLSALLLGRQIGFSRAQSYYLTTAVSELANNLVFHTDRGGILSLQVLDDGDRIGIEVVAEDQGPGIAHLALAMEDGYSTNGGLGGGLPGVKRLMDDFEIRSHPGTGTTIRTRKWLSCK